MVHSMTVVCLQLTVRPATTRKAGSVWFVLSAHFLRVRGRHAAHLVILARRQQQQHQALLANATVGSLKFASSALKKIKKQF